MAGLRACPFCGETHVRMDSTPDSSPRDEWRLRCAKCGATSPWKSSVERAGAAWQTRPLEDAKDAQIAALQAEVARLTAMVPTWIPVDEQKPTHGSEVLAVDQFSEIAVCKADGSAHWWRTTYEGLLTPTHWMELPQLPEVKP